MHSFFTFLELSGSLAFAVHWLLQSTLLLGVGLVLGRLLQSRGSAVQSAVYRTTLVAVLLCPFATWSLSQAGLSDWSLAGVEESSKTTVGKFAEPIAAPLLQTPRVETLQATGIPVQGAITPNAKMVSTPAVRQPISRFAIATAAASMITSALLLRLALAWVRLARLRRQAVSADTETLGLCRELAETLKVPAPAVLCSPFVPSPCLAGIRRPAVLLPEENQQLSMRDVLVHELAHLRRHDCHWNLLRRAATALFWFQPLLWKLSSRLEATAEEVCDDFVVQYGANRQEYAHRLVDIAELSLASIAAAGVGMVSLRSMLAQRIARILDTSRKLSTQVNSRLLAAVLAGGLVGTLVVGLVGVGSQESQAETNVSTENVEIADKQEKSSREEGWPLQFRLRIVGPQGNPVPDTKVEIRTGGKLKGDQILGGKYIGESNYGIYARTDGKGQLLVSLHSPPKRFNLSIKQPGYGPYLASWNSTSHSIDIPSTFTARLDAGWSVGGVVVDHLGRQVANVKIRPSIEFKKRPGDTDQLFVGASIEADSEGKWRFDSIPTSLSQVSVEITHPAYKPLRRSLPRDGFEIPSGKMPVTRIQLQQGLAVTGTVTDEEGEPITGSLVRTKFMNDIREASTDEKGEYVLLGCESRMTRVVVSAKGKATDMQEVRVDAEMAPVNFSMKPGGKIRIRVVDEQGKGISKARIFFQRWRGMIGYFEFDHVSQYADKNGVWEWNEAPLDEFQADICRPGGMQLSRQILIAREEEYVFKPHRTPVVSGSVLDAKTKQPIQSFRAISGLRNSAPRGGTNWTPAAEISATILTAAGQPAAKAKVAVGVSGSQLMIKAGRIDERSTNAKTLDADTEGRFRTSARKKTFQLVIIHSAGFAHLKSSDGPIPSRITLTPWARVEGTFRVGAEPAPNVVLSLFSGGINSYGNDVPHISTFHEVTTDKDGRYAFKRLFPGQGSICRHILLRVNDGATEVTSSQRISAEFIAGKTTHLDLRGTGRPVIGKLVAPAEYTKNVFWNFANVSVQVDLKAPGPPKPPADVQIEPGKYNAWFKEWITTDEGKAWFSTYQADMKAYRKLRSKTPYMMASVDRDGSFRIDDAPSGEFVFRVSFSRHAPGGISNYKFSIPEIEGLRSDQPFDLGTLELDPLSALRSQPRTH